MWFREPQHTIQIIGGLMRKFIFIVLISLIMVTMNLYASGTQNQAERATTDEVKLMPGIVVTTPLSFDADMTAVIITQPADHLAEMVSFAHSRGAANGSQNVVLRTNNENQSRLQYQINKYFIASGSIPQVFLTLLPSADAINQDDGTAVITEVEIVKLWPNCNLGRLDTKVNFIAEVLPAVCQLYMLNKRLLL